jgi:large conductance mechanosensitive channel
MKGSSVWQEFKAFAFKGNMIDLALAVVLGGAFGGVVNALAKNILMPLLSYVLPGPGSYRGWHVGRVEVGAFLGELLNFFVIAGAMYLLIVKVLGSVQKAAGLADPSKPTTKECPLCLSVIPYKARRCAHCTADLPDAVPE